MWWSYPFKVNLALAKMSVDPVQFDGKWRSNMQQFGNSRGLTPEETALVIVGCGMGINFPDFVEAAIGFWQNERRIDLCKPEVIVALERMGFKV